MIKVATAGMVPPGASGVTDYGRILHEALRRRGLVVDEHWTVNGGVSASDAVHATVDILRRSRRIDAGSVVLWHYSSFAYGIRGIPFPGVMFGLLARWRGARVVTVLHEAAYPWGRRGVRGNVQALTQRVALVFVLLASDRVTVTMEKRAEMLRRLPRPLRRPVRTLPVFSTVGEPVTVVDRPQGTGVVGVLSYGSDSVQPRLLLEALHVLPRDVFRRLVLLGAPGPGSVQAERWRSAARDLGLDDRLEFTGVVTPSELSHALTSCDLLFLPDPDGPTARKTTLAAALAHGVPTVALAGPDQWDDLLTEGAVVAAPARAPALAAVLGDLLEPGPRRQEVGTRGHEFYTARMRVDLAADGVAGVVRELHDDRRAVPSLPMRDARWP